MHTVDLFMGHLTRPASVPGQAWAMISDPYPNPTHKNPTQSAKNQEIARPDLPVCRVGLRSDFEPTIFPGPSPSLTWRLNRPSTQSNYIDLDH